MKLSPLKIVHKEKRMGCLTSNMRKVTIKRKLAMSMCVFSAPRALIFQGKLVTTHL